MGPKESSQLLQVKEPMTANPHLAGLSGDISMGQGRLCQR